MALGSGITHSIGVRIAGYNALSGASLKASHSLDQFRKKAEGVAARVNKLRVSSIDTAAIDQAANKMSSLGKRSLVAGGLMTAGLGLFVNESMKLEAAMGEVSTLVDTSTTDMAALEAQVKSLSAEIGELPVNTTKALYTTISAGFGDAADATVVLRGSMKLAVGGIADLGVAIDGVTSIMNAYGMKASEVSGVTDLMFVAMKRGKTTIGELAGSIGKVGDMAASVGVPLKEILASVSALTLGGKGTSEAFTSVRQTLASVLRPTEKARKEAKRLSIEFSAAALKSMGLSNWLKHLRAKTGGSKESIAKLFESVEALTGVMALMGPQSSNLISILGDMDLATGSTKEAFSKMSATAGHTFKRLRANVNILSTTIGDKLLPVVTTLAAGISIAAGSFSAFADAHPTLTTMGVTLLAVTAATLLLGGAGLIVSAQLMTAATVAGVAWKSILGPIGLVIAGITLLVTVGSWLARKSKEDGSVVARIWTRMKDTFVAVSLPIVTAATFIATVVSTAWNEIYGVTSSVFGNIWKLIKVALLPVYVALLPVFALLKGVATTAFGVFATVAMTSLKGVWSTVKLFAKLVFHSIAIVWNLVAGPLKAAFQLFTGDVSGAFETLSNAFDNVWFHLQGIGGAFVDWFSGLEDIFMDAGRGLMDAFFGGLTAGWETLKSGFIGMLEFLEGFLPHSDAKRGPLSNLTASGRALPQTFAKGIVSASDEPALAVKQSFESFDLLGSGGASKSVPAESIQNIVNTSSSSQHNAPITIAKGAVQIIMQPGETMDDLEERLTEMLMRLTMRLGGNHA